MNRTRVFVVDTIECISTEANRVPKWKLFIAKIFRIPVAPSKYHYKLKLLVDDVEYVELNDVFLYGGERFFCAAKCVWQPSDLIELRSLQPIQDPNFEPEDTEVTLITRAFTEQ
jgi:hypothetical protein